jgi:hypothetical protein
MGIAGGFRHHDHWTPTVEQGLLDSLSIVAEEIVACIENRDVVETCLLIKALDKLVEIEIGLVDDEDQTGFPGYNAGGGTDSFDELSPPFVLSIGEARGEAA